MLKIASFPILVLLLNCTSDNRDVLDSLGNNDSIENGANLCGEPTDNENTDCGVVLCAEDEHVVSNQCVPCPPTHTNDAGDDPNLSNTECLHKPCAENEFALSNHCVSCPELTTNAAGDLPDAGNTECDPIACEENEFVQSNVCEPCPAGSTNTAGDLPINGETSCDLEATTTGTNQEFDFACQNAQFVVMGDNYHEPGYHLNSWPTAAGYFNRQGNVNVPIDGSPFLVRTTISTSSNFETASLEILNRGVIKARLYDGCTNLVKEWSNGITVGPGFEKDSNGDFVDKNYTLVLQIPYIEASLYWIALQNNVGAVQFWVDYFIAVSYTHLTLPTICSV